MGEVSRYPNGAFCWVDLSTTDLPGAKAFYGGLFGWEMEDLPVPGSNTYTMCRLRGLDVTAISPQVPQNGAPAPPHWNSYVSFDDIGSATGRAHELGATVLAEPFDVIGTGQMAVVQDPSDAVVCLWEPKTHIGARLVNEPGTWTWNDLGTRDTDAARSFYTDLFGWTFREVAPGYFSISMGDLLIGGMRSMVNDAPEVPPHWMPYFVVYTAAEATSRVEELGGRVIVPATDVPAGKFLVYQDPTGVASGAIEMGPEGPARGVDAS